MPTITFFGERQDITDPEAAVHVAGLDAVLAQWRLHRREKSGIILEETYLAVVVCAYSAESANLSGSAATAG